MLKFQIIMCQWSQYSIEMSMETLTGSLAQYRVLLAADSVIKNKKSSHINPSQKLLQYEKSHDNDSADDNPPT